MNYQRLRPTKTHLWRLGLPFHKNHRLDAREPSQVRVQNDHQVQSGFAYQPMPNHQHFEKNDDSIFWFYWNDRDQLVPLLSILRLLILFVHLHQKSPFLSFFGNG
ncbi:hypothetical protein THIOM_002682 [Candidatus Thiomargarita nelsonii]|uniref:Uncharacterized protein n=1 Tax=Candidatus Thiomargarita nelsonii TaxID=1003181 RepID=A0A176S0S5_9GAMM|nr:hypothetical protein THIOM_002682 [Candidatus Thiomargarita nelsonii]